MGYVAFPVNYSQQWLCNSVPSPAHLSTLSQISQVAQHATIAHLRPLAGLVGLILNVRADVFEDALQNVLGQALGKIAAAACGHGRDLAS